MLPARRRGAKTVIPAHRSGAASTRSSFAGILWVNAAGATTYSAYPPFTVTPVLRWEAHSISAPALHGAHWPQAYCIQGTPTGSPGEKDVTPSPTFSTEPVTSCPGTMGSGVPQDAQSPSTRCRSLWQTPQPFTRISTSPGQGEG